MSIAIDKRSGALVVAGATMPIDLSENAFAQSALGQRATRTPSVNGWVIYSKIRVDDVGLVLRFLDGKLTEAALAFASPGDDWGDWSEEKESSVKREHDNWLASQLGAPPYAFDWGSVESLNDKKTGGSLILVRYRRA